MIKVTRGKEVWEFSNARITMDIDPVAGLRILILADLKIDGKIKAPYGKKLSGKEAVIFYDKYVASHKLLYEELFKNSGITVELPEKIIDYVAPKFEVGQEIYDNPTYVEEVSEEETKLLIQEINLIKDKLDEINTKVDTSIKP